MENVGLLIVHGMFLLFIVTHSAYAQDVSKYRVNSFISDYHRYEIGDVAPEIYFSKEYYINQWKIRHLTAPLDGTHWSYMYGTYVLLNEHSHRIIMAYNSDIFYKSLP
ncbi:RcnB family protein [Enterobacter bugandensis]|uniref:RcnB family protein n=1 Tax=Enterobacter bugandensis TaxID=881260 RepID=UPI002002C477|nr:RcnB family protein [Enterobacter bugandensis]MCK6880100.1 RcnB family protein [Enterobacter bugandensis]